MESKNFAILDYADNSKSLPVQVTFEGEKISISTGGKYGRELIIESTDGALMVRAFDAEAGGVGNPITLKLPKTGAAQIA